MISTLGTMAEEKVALPVVLYCYNAPVLSTSWDRNTKQCVNVISYKMGTCVPGFPSAPSVPSGPLRPCQQKTHKNCTTAIIINYADPLEKSVHGPYRRSRPTRWPMLTGSSLNMKVLFNAFFFFFLRLFVSHWIKSGSYPLSSGPNSSSAPRFSPVPLRAQSSAKP